MQLSSTPAAGCACLADVLVWSPLWGLRDKPLLPMGTVRVPSLQAAGCTDVLHAAQALLQRIAADLALWRALTGPAVEGDPVMFQSASARLLRLQEAAAQLEVAA